MLYFVLISCPSSLDTLLLQDPYDPPPSPLLSSSAIWVAVIKSFATSFLNTPLVLASALRLLGQKLKGKSGEYVPVQGCERKCRMFRFLDLESELFQRYP